MQSGPSSSIGCVIALRDEAVALAPGRWRWRALRALGGARARWGGPGSTSAKGAAEALLAAGCTRLLSWGVCGALDPALAPGEVVLPRAVIDEHARYPCDAAWHAELRNAIGDHRRVHEGVLCTPRALVAEVAAKRDLHHASGAIAADLESAAVAAVAAAHAVPFLALRAVADHAQDRLPPAVCAAIGADGRPRPFATLAALLLHPDEWRLLPATRRRFKQGCATLAALRTVVIA